LTSAFPIQRWVAGISLDLPRFRGGRKVPPQLARMGAEDLITTVFPDQLACAENLVGEREIPDHPLVNQTIADCLTDAMDIEGLEQLLCGLESGSIRVITRDLTEPSPLATEVLAARPYAYLDDAPLEERRTQAVMTRRWLSPDAASNLGHLDAAAVSRVQAETWPDPQNADDLHDALMWLGFLTSKEVEKGPGWREWAYALAGSRRATMFKAGPLSLWVSAERLPQFLAIWPQAALEPPISAPHPYSKRNWALEDALVEILRGRLEGVGPITEAELAGILDLSAPSVAGRSRPCNPKGLHLGAASRRELKQTNGANVGFLRASIAIRRSASEPRSSPSPHVISCASCSTGSGYRPMHAWRARMPFPPSLISLRALRRQLVRGKARSFPPALQTMNRNGSTISALRAGCPGSG